METTANFGDLMRGMEARFADVFVQNSEQYESDLSKLKVYKPYSDAAIRKIFHNRSGTGFLSSNHQGGDVNEKKRYLAYKTEAVPTNYDGGITVTYDKIKYNDYQAELDEYADLIKSGHASMDLTKSMPFCKAFVTTQPTLNGIKLTRYGDGVALCSVVHPTRVPGQSSQSNASGSSIQLTYSNFDTARQAIIQQKTDDGMPLTVAPNFVLMVGPALRTKALEIAGSSQKVDSADNNINVFQGEVVDVIENLYLTTDFGASTNTQWFVIDRNRLKLFFWLSEQLVTNMYKHRNRSVSFDVFAAWACGHLDWRGVWGSLGDDSSYAS